MYNQWWPTLTPVLSFITQQHHTPSGCVWFFTPVTTCTRPSMWNMYGWKLIFYFYLPHPPPTPLLLWYFVYRHPFSVSLLMVIDTFLTKIQLCSHLCFSLEITYRNNPKTTFPFYFWQFSHISPCSDTIRMIDTHVKFSMYDDNILGDAPDFQWFWSSQIMRCNAW